MTQTYDTSAGVPVLGEAVRPDVAGRQFPGQRRLAALAWAEQRGDSKPGQCVLNLLTIACTVDQHDS